MCDRPDGGHYALVDGVKMVVLDDEVIVFNPFSWETHLFNPAASIAVELAAAGALSATSLIHELEQALHADERHSAATYAARLIEELQSLRLLLQ